MKVTLYLPETADFLALTTVFYPYDKPSGIRRIFLCRPEDGLVIIRDNTADGQFETMTGSSKR